MTEVMRHRPQGGGNSRVLVDPTSAMVERNCGDFLRQFADAVLHQSSPTNTSRTATCHVIRNEMRPDDPPYVNVSNVSGSFATMPSLSQSSRLTQAATTASKTSTVNRKLNLSSISRHRKRKLEDSHSSGRSSADEDFGAKVPPTGARRNERERNRVRQVNAGFDRLRDHVPQGRRNRKLSKVDTLRAAVDYIAQLQLVLGGGGGPYLLSSSAPLATGQPTTPPTASIDPSDKLGDVLRDINSNTVGGHGFLHHDVDRHNKLFPNAVFGEDERFEKQFISDDSSSSSSTSMTELLFQMATAAAASIGNENLHPVITSVNEEGGRSATGLGNSSAMMDAVVERDALYYAHRTSSLLVTNGPAVAEQRVKYVDAATGPLSSSASSYNSGCCFSVSSFGDDEHVTQQTCGADSTTDGDLTSWLHDQH